MVRIAVTVGGGFVAHFFQFALIPGWSKSDPALNEDCFQRHAESVVYKIKNKQEPWMTQSLTIACTSMGLAPCPSPEVRRHTLTSCALESLGALLPPSEVEDTTKYATLYQRDLSM